ncbi:DNA primase small subunit PriS [Salinirubrum litoreum]|uniref:DNA primase small subunit PriS n=1 Tax=Salinirubrum litoreum TaxID=1126234 RepID=A0ABD5R9X8_9EURY|nr:DNA primase small subunit PriS [Salinirubrum litoreum]
MEGRTRRYLQGRFRDYYRGVDLDLPPAADRREWGHIPWTSGTGTTMIRHQSLLDLGDLATFLREDAPRHVYFSAARFRDPGASRMADKGWESADLVFDLDADHLPGVDPEATSYAEMLSACKDALLRLLDLLDDDFAFTDTEVVFSGGRGYHVHVRDEGVAELDSEERREIVDYIRANDLDLDGLIETRAVEGTPRRVLRTEGGWGRRVHENLLDYVAELQEMDEDDAMDRLQELDGIGEGRATTILGAVEANPDAIQRGNVEAGGPGVRTLLQAIARETVGVESGGRIDAETAPIDEPVTTDTNRLIRFPGSLHGGSGLRVVRLDRGELADFDPLVDAVPARFTDREIAVEVMDPVEGRLGGDSFTLSAGRHSVPEHVGVFLMARGQAEKVQQ